MSFFISDAVAQTATATSGGGLEGLILPIGLIIILYFFMIRPQMKRQKEQTKMVENLQKGDEIQIEGGLMGKITELGDSFAKVEIAEGVEVNVRRASVAQVMLKGTLKDLS